MDDVDLPKQIANVSKTIPTALAGCTSSKFVKDLRENVGKRAKTVGRRKKRLAVLEKKYSCTARTLNQDLLKRVCLVAAALEAHKAEDARAQFWMTSKAALVLARAFDALVHMCGAYMTSAADDQVTKRNISKRRHRCGRRALL